MPSVEALRDVYQERTPGSRELWERGKDTMPGAAPICDNLLGEGGVG